MATCTCSMRRIFIISHYFGRLGQIGHGISGFGKFLERSHYRGAREEFAEEIDFAAKLIVRNGLDEFFGGGASRAVEFRNLSRGGAGDFEGFALRGELSDKAHGLRASGVHAAPGE